MLFDDSQGLVIPVDELLWIEKCVDCQEGKACIRYVTKDGQGITVRPYSCVALRDEVYQTCRQLMGQHHTEMERWNRWNREMVQKGLTQQINHIEKEERGW